MRARSLHDRARAAGVPCITTTGIYPGVSNLMAAHIAAIAAKEYGMKGESSCHLALGSDQSWGRIVSSLILSLHSL